MAAACANPRPGRISQNVIWLVTTTQSQRNCASTFQPVSSMCASALRDAARRSALAHMDETGWKVEAQLRWLWVVVTSQITFCEILPGRGFAQAASMLGADY